MVPNQSDTDIPVPTLIRSIYLFRSGIDYEKGPRHVTAIFCFLTIKINYISEDFWKYKKKEQEASQAILQRLNQILQL